MKFFAVLRDESFIARVSSGTEAFTALDVLRCVIRHTQWRDGTGLHSEVEVLRVLEHIPHDPAIQPEMFPRAEPDEMEPPPGPLEIGPRNDDA